MNSKVLKRAIELSWIILVICFIVKAVGGNWFSMNFTNTWLERHVWATIFVSITTNYILFSLYYLAICEVKHFKWWVHVALVPYIFVIQVLKVMAIPANFHILLDLLSNFVIPGLLIMYLNGKPRKSHLKKYFRIITAFVLNCGFQAISVMVRSIAVSVTVTNLFVQLIMTLDVFIMLALYWFYSLFRKEEVKKMSIMFTFLIGKNKEELEALLKEAQEKLAKDPGNLELEEEVAVIEKALEEH